MTRIVTEGLQSIPGVGQAVERDLRALGIQQISDLRGRSPEDLYNRLCVVQGRHVDRCMLYVLRCAVYYASTPSNERDAKKCLWWNWKD